MARARATQTTDQQQQLREQNAAQHAQARAGQTAEEQQQRREEDAAQHAQARAAQAAAAEQPQPPIVVVSPAEAERLAGHSVWRAVRPVLQAVKLHLLLLRADLPKGRSHQAKAPPSL